MLTKIHQKYAERGELPDRLPISAIAALHPEGERFAQALLSAWAAHEYRRHLVESPDAFIPPDCPPPSDDEPGLPAMIEDSVMLATFAEHRGLGPDLIAKSPLTNLHEWEWEPRIGEFIFVRRDDLKTWLIEREAWPLPSDAKLRLWWGNSRKRKGRRERQHDRIIESEAAYSTPHIEIMNAAIAEFFAPRRAVDAAKPEVTAWVMRQMELLGVTPSSNIAEAIFTIIKPFDHDPRKRRG